MSEPIKVLFLCTHNSARSQIAEALLRSMGGGDFDVHSAGTEVTRVHPLALRVLEERGIDTSGLYSKHLQAMIGKPWDMIITVCDNARDACPVFPGDAERIHWSLPDPSAVEGTEEERLAAFREIRQNLIRRLQLFIPAQQHVRELQGRARSTGGNP